ncbi:Rv2231c family pyridoxal phosphate-dependent protein CobC [Nocardioides sp.]|uniref:Rv2231c family pyridoxal phosphate-dependent protein CobC n=1 Tax=Nocardioides sp. TaxID=35761 RepID=UPI002B712FE0|nr:Rv2231c family pyridoxal phosphate-dependent protein CobC [Nocardioides sp.]HSX68028.1 Rv2231c family pyridoxal phosphate-dependent protein CobC [Nocardioides sp.]
MSVVLGVGGRAAADPGALLALVQQQLAAHGLSAADVDTVATIDSRAEHPGVALLAVSLDAGIRAFSADDLAGQPVAHPSPTVQAHSGTPSVAEAAVLASGVSPLGPPVTCDDWVVVVGRLEPATGLEWQISDRDSCQSRPVAAQADGQPGYELTHHGDVEVEPGMLDFAVNVHAAEPPAFLSEALHAAIADLARYPDPTRATADVARAHGVDPECVLLTHGAAEAFGLVAQQPWQRPAVVHPQFTEPEAALRSHGHDPARLVLTPDTGFRLSGLAPHNVDLVVVGNPTNPTSRLHPRAEIEALAAHDRLVLVDEAFLDVVEPIDAPEHSLVRAAAADPRFLVTRSLTKTYSIAGLRIGYLVGHPDVLRRLAARRSPWPVSTLAAVAAEACVSPTGLAYAAEVRRRLPAQLAALGHTLGARGFRVVDTPAGPFVLAQHPEASRIREELRARKIAVRRADTFPGLDETWLRFAARGEDQLAALDAALRRCVSR